MDFYIYVDILRKRTLDVAHALRVAAYEGERHLCARADALRFSHTRPANRVRISSL